MVHIKKLFKKNVIGLMEEGPCYNFKKNGRTEIFWWQYGWNNELFRKSQDN